MSKGRAPVVGQVASRYARALFELAGDSGAQDRVAADLAALSALWAGSEELSTSLSGAALPGELQQDILKAVLSAAGIGDLVERLAKMLLSRRRLSIVPAIESSYRALVDAQKNVLRGTVTAAEALTESEATDLSRAFEKRFKKKVVLDPVINKEILGGVVVQVQGLTFDGSLKTAIRRMRETLERQSL